MTQHEPSDANACLQLNINSGVSCRQQKHAKQVEWPWPERAAMFQPCSRISLLVEGVDILNQLLDRTSPRTIGPLAIISNASDLSCQPYGTALGDVTLLTSQYTRSKQVKSIAFVTDAGIQLLEIYTMFHGTALDKVAVRDILIVGRQAIGKAEIYFRVRVDFCSAEFNDVTQALGRSMHTRNRIRVVVDAKERVNWSVIDNNKDMHTVQ